MWGEYVPPEGGQGSISLGYKTCTSVNLFDILVIGMDVSAESSVFLYVLRSKTTHPLLQTISTGLGGARKKC